MDQVRERHDAGEARDFNIFGVDGANAVPIGNLLPAFVVIGILRTVIDNDAATEDANVLNVEKVDAAVEPGAGFEVDDVTRFGVEVLVVDAGVDDFNGGRDCGGGEDGRGAVKEEEHFGVVEKIVGARDGEFGRGGEFEADGLSGPRWADAETPGFDFDAVIPEAGFECGDGDFDALRRRTGGVRGESKERSRGLMLRGQHRRDGR